MASLEDRIKWDRLDPSHKPAFAPSSSRRSVVFGTKGVVACVQPLAAEAGLEVLRKGGNAADAAVATAAALNVTEPCNCGLGGDVFCLYWNAKDKTVKGLNASGRSPAALTLERARALGHKGKELPLRDINTVTVPGAAAGWIDTLSLFGSGKVSMSDVLAPATRLADEGFPVSELVAGSWQRQEKLLKTASPNGHELLVDGDHAPRASEIFTNKTLARTFGEIAAKGKEGFYKGRIAEEIVKLVKSKGGVLELSDLEKHTSTPVDPISYHYHSSNRQGGGVTLHETPPNGQGLAALMALGILEKLEASAKVPDLSTVEHNGTVWLHALIECLRFAFADVRSYVADPAKEKVPVEELLSDAYLEERAKLFDPKKAVADVQKGSPLREARSDTVYLATADEHGNACSFIMSNFDGFGTGAVPAGCGFSLQNRGAGFSLQDGHPNCLGPSKRPYHTIIPAMATRGGDLMMAYGVMGGFMQPQGHVQVLLNMLHHGLHAQHALDAPRFCISAGLPAAADEGIDLSSIFLEEGIKTEVAEELVKMGHKVTVVSGFARGMFGRGQIVHRLGGDRLVWACGSDQRGDGHAVAQV